MNNVKRLVQTSSVDAVSPLRDCVEEDEDSLPYPPESELVMPEYASTKMKAEKLVLGSHGRPLADGKMSQSFNFLHLPVKYFSSQSSANINNFPELTWG